MLMLLKNNLFYIFVETVMHFVQESLDQKKAIIWNTILFCSNVNYLKVLFEQCMFYFVSWVKRISAFSYSFVID